MSSSADRTPSRSGRWKRERVAAALLAARDGLAAVHQLGHVLEADPGLDERGSERARDAVDLEGRRERLRDPALLAAAAEDVEQQQREDLVRRDEPALRVEHAQPIGVAVLRDGEVEAPRAHALRGGREVRGDRLGVHAAEERVARGAEGLDAQGARAARQDLGDQGARGPVHRVGEDGEPRRADRRDVDERGEALAVGRREVRDLDRPAPRGRRQRDGRPRRRWPRSPSAERCRRSGP